MLCSTIVNMGFRTQKLSVSLPFQRITFLFIQIFINMSWPDRLTPEMQEEQEYQILNQKSQTVQTVKEPK